MKTRVLVIGLTMAAALMAQPPEGGFRRNANATPPTPQELIQRQVDRMTRFLTLSSAQQTQVTNFLSANINNLTSFHATMKTEHEAVIAAIKANSGGVASAVAAASSTQAQVETIRANEAAAIYAILTADQKTKIGDGLAMLSGGGGGGHGPGPGGRGRGFGPPK